MTDPLQARVDAWRDAHASDPRRDLCAVTVVNRGDGVALVGDALDDVTADGLLATVRRRAGLTARDEMRRLLPGAPRMAITRAVANVRKEPTERSELLTQALLGETVAVLKTDGDWAFVRLDADGYLGWTACHALSAHLPPPATHVVAAPLADLYAAVDGERRTGKAPFGVAVAVAETRGERAALALPGYVAWVMHADLLPLAERPAPDGAGVRRALRLVSRFVGVPYLWGGRTPFGFDCSGLAQTTLRLVGLPAPRDADMQYAACDPVDGEPQPGDLLFFGRPGYSASGIVRTAGVSHVAVSLGGQDYLHATQTVWGTAYGSLDPASPIAYRAANSQFLGARRMPCA